MSECPMEGVMGVHTHERHMCIFCGEWRCPLCLEEGFNERTLGAHIRQEHPISDVEHEALDDAEVAGPLEGSKTDAKGIEELMRNVFEDEMGKQQASQPSLEDGKR